MKWLLLFTANLCFGSIGYIGNNFSKGCGVLIHPKVVLTSAHILYNQVGVTFNGKYHGKCFCHPLYKKERAPSITSCEYDIALFILKEQVLDIPCIPLSYKIANRTLITANKSLLSYGDSGSPWIENERVLAIASAIVGENKEHNRVVYTCIFPHINWIEKTIEENL